MNKRKFHIYAEIYAELELDEHVIDVVDNQWRSQLYDLQAPEEIAEHIAYNLLQGRCLSQLDGWADQPNKNAYLLIDEFHVDAEELRVDTLTTAKRKFRLDDEE